MKTYIIPSSLLLTSSLLSTLFLSACSSIVNTSALQDDLYFTPTPEGSGAVTRPVEASSAASANYLANAGNSNYNTRLEGYMQTARANNSLPETRDFSSVQAYYASQPEVETNKSEEIQFVDNSANISQEPVQVQASEGVWLDGFYGSSLDRSYAERMIKFHGPFSTVSYYSPMFTHARYSGDWNIYISNNSAYFVPTWTNPYYNDFYFGFGWGWDRFHRNAWRYQWGWNYGFDYGWGWGYHPWYYDHYSFYHPYHYGFYDWGYHHYAWHHPYYYGYHHYNYYHGYHGGWNHDVHQNISSRPRDTQPRGTGIGTGGRHVTTEREANAQRRYSAGSPSSTYGSGSNSNASATQSSRSFTRPTQATRSTSYGATQSSSSTSRANATTSGQVRTTTRSQQATSQSSTRSSSYTPSSTRGSGNVTSSSSRGNSVHSSGSTTRSSSSYTSGRSSSSRSSSTTIRSNSSSSSGMRSSSPSSSSRSSSFSSPSPSSHSSGMRSSGGGSSSSGRSGGGRR